MTMGCVASAVAAREKNKVQTVPTPKMLRGDLISRGEAKERRNKSISEHHAKSKKHAQTVVYNTMAEKEMVSTSTERSYRSSRGFLISAMATMSTDTNASEQGSCSTVSDGTLQSSIQETVASKIRKDPPNKTATSLPYSVPEEESVRCPSSGDVKGHCQEVMFQARGQDVDIETILGDQHSHQRTEDEANTKTNIDDCQVKGQGDDLKSKMTDEDILVKNPSRVRFKKHRNQARLTNEGRKSKVDHKPKANGPPSLPAG